MKSYRSAGWLDGNDMPTIMCAWYCTSCCIQHNCQMLNNARAQALKTLSSTLPSILSHTLSACLTMHSKQRSQYAPKHGHEYALKYSPNCTQWHTPSLLHCMLLCMLWRCSQIHSEACSQLYSAEARHSQSHLTICFGVCSWMRNPETCSGVGAAHQNMGGRWR